MSGSAGGEVELISFHGGHSGEFCCHASGSLEEVIRGYLERGFRRVGISEHIPPPSDRWLYPDEVAAGMDAAALRDRFRRYIAAGRELQERYRERITVYLGAETESWTGWEEAVGGLAGSCRPDYLVGSVHHVEDVPFDFSPEEYAAAVEKSGGTEQLYRRYFDLQLEMIEKLRTGVVGHFDLIRIYDPGWRSRITRPPVADLIRRNLERMAELSLILDCNCRLLPAGGETYPAREILLRAREIGVAAVPGDDSHSPAEAGQGIREGIELLRELGFSTDWPLPCPAGAEPGEPQQMT